MVIDLLKEAVDRLRYLEPEKFDDAAHEKNWRKFLIHADAAIAEHEETDTTKAYRDAAKTAYHSEGTIEIDDNATVSISEDGGATVYHVKLGRCRRCGIDTTT